MAQGDLFVPRVIGLAGPKYAGKDTAANLLEGVLSAAGISYRRIAFSDPIKRMLQTMLSDMGISWSGLHDPKRKEEIIPELGVSYRHLMVTLGTEWGRDLINRELWLQPVRHVCETLPQDMVLVITDVRMPNEAKLIEDLGGEVWEVYRPGANYSTEHVSESGLPVGCVRRTLRNWGSLEDLNTEVVKAWQDANRGRE